MNADDTIRRGHEADRLLTDPLFIEAFATVESEITAAWREAPARDSEGRERLWLMVQLLEKVRGHIATIAASGKIERDRIEMLDKERKLFGHRF